MTFEPILVLDQIKALYAMPRDRKRFDAYLRLLQGDSKDDMLLPIGGYNPMAKDLAPAKVQALIDVGAESLLAQELLHINEPLVETPSDRVLGVAINVADDVEGAWSERHTTDFASKFGFGALLKRDFCAPYFWTSETYNESLISQRIRAYVYRSMYWIQHGQPVSLRDHVAQEVFVHQQANSPVEYADHQIDESIEEFYQVYQDSEEHTLIFNFFYGDEASEALGYQCFGFPPQMGFQYAQHLASQSLSR